MSLTDLRYALRNLRLAPGFALAAIGSIALGIAGNVTVFSLVNAILLKPLPYPEANRLVAISSVLPSGADLGVLGIHILRWRSEVESFESIEGVYTSLKNTRNLDGPGDPESVGAVRITAGFFDQLGVKPQLGRWFTRSEEQLGEADVVILSDALWRRRFSADPRAIDSRILLDGQPHTVIGVAPPDLHFFRGHQLDRLRLMPEHVDVFTPIRLRPAELAGRTPNPVYMAIARLKRGRSPQQARGEVVASMARLRADHPEIEELQPVVQPLETTLVGNTRKPLLIILGAVGLVLLIVCVNVANLLLVRGMNRRRELAVRAALGASRGQLLRQSLTESALLGLLGTAFGVLLASWMMDLVIHHAPLEWTRLEDTALDGNVLGFAMAACFLTTVLFGLIPAWRASQSSPLESLHGDVRGSTDGPGARRIRTALVSLEVALSTVLLIGAGLLLASWQRILNAPRGFATQNVIAMDLRLSDATYRTADQQRSFFRRVRDGVASIPGVLQVGYSEALPFIQKWDGFIVVKEEGSEYRSLWRDASTGNFANAIEVSAGYFQTLGIPLLEGRLFTDDSENELVAVLSKSAAQKIWPGENAVGKRFRHDQDRRWTRVIGIVADARTETMGRDAQPTFYIPYFQLGGPQINLLVHSALDPAALAHSIRDQVRKVDAAVPIPEIHSMTGVVSQAVAPRRFQAVLVAGFAVLALILASIGIFGVVSYVVLQRRAEIGVRIALGAHPSEACSLVLRQGMRPVALGLGAGILLAAAVTRLMTGLLFEVHALDPETFVAAPLILGTVAALASYLPARRASKIDAMEALRYQ
jgi:putative ABC transport system permease protein